MKNKAVDSYDTPAQIYAADLTEHNVSASAVLTLGSKQACNKSINTARAKSESSVSKERTK